MEAHEAPPDKPHPAREAPGPVLARGRAPTASGGERVRVGSRDRQEASLLGGAGGEGPGPAAGVRHTESRTQVIDRTAGRTGHRRPGGPADTGRRPAAKRANQSRAGWREAETPHRPRVPGAHDANVTCAGQESFARRRRRPEPGWRGLPAYRHPGVLPEAPPDSAGCFSGPAAEQASARGPRPRGTPRPGRRGVLELHLNPQPRWTGSAPSNAAFLPVSELPPASPPPLARAPTIRGQAQRLRGPPAVCHVPQAHRPVPGGAGQDGLHRAKAQTADGALVAGQNLW